METRNDGGNLSFKSIKVTLGNAEHRKKIGVSVSITKTRLYNFDPIKPHFYIQYIV